MRKIKGGMIVFFWLLILFHWSEVDVIAQTKTTYVTEEGSIRFVSEAPLEIIRAASSSLKGAIDIEQKSFLFILDNASFKGFNSPLQQEHFHENYMETKTYPQTTFKGKIIELPLPMNGTTQTVRAKGILDLHGVKAEWIIKAVLIYEEGQIHIKADFSIFLEDHAIRIPKVVSKKIAPEIQVTVDAVMRANN
jgi:hypothetical protein